MPELLGRYFTKQAGITQVTYLCKCNGLHDGQRMILCGNDNGQIAGITSKIWQIDFHYQLLYLNVLEPNVLLIPVYTKKS
nr:unnamed protein product [Callosobruchus analis]